MGKFASAKCQGATDTKLQEAYNRLIDLLDRGQAFESNVNGHTTRITLDSNGGFSVFVDGTQTVWTNPVTAQLTIGTVENNAILTLAYAVAL